MPEKNFANILFESLGGSLGVADAVLTAESFSGDKLQTIVLLMSVPHRWCITCWLHPVEPRSFLMNMFYHILLWQLLRVPQACGSWEALGHWDTYKTQGSFLNMASCGCSSMIQNSSTIGFSRCFLSVDIHHLLFKYVPISCSFVCGVHVWGVSVCASVEARGRYWWFPSAILCRSP